MNIQQEIVCFFFKSAMVLLWPLRLLGLMGTKGHPVQFEQGDKVPFWLFLLYPFSARATFQCPAECYYDYRTTEMVVTTKSYPDPMIYIDRSVVCVGARTHLRHLGGMFPSPSPSSSS